MSEAYDAEQRRRITEALRSGSDLKCPECAALLTAQPVETRRELSYVRNRIWVLCPACKRSASIDVPPGA